MKLKPTDEQIQFLSLHGRVAPASRREANVMIAKIIDEARVTRARAEAERTGLVRALDPGVVSAAFLKSLEVGEGTVLRDTGGPFVVARVMSDRMLKVFRHGSIPGSVEYLLNDPVRGWMVRPDLVLEARPPRDTVFSLCVTARTFDESKRLVRFIKSHIEPHHVRDTQYGVYWDSAAVGRLKTRFEEAGSNISGP